MLRTVSLIIVAQKKVIRLHITQKWLHFIMRGLQRNSGFQKQLKMDMDVLNWKNSSQKLKTNMSMGLK